MNERIKELYEQADSYARAEYEKWAPTDDFSGVPHIRNICNEKFAELIVRECLDIGANHKAYALMGEIMEHFGIEE